MPVRKLTFTALFIAIGVFSAHIVYIPVIVAKCFPVQHAINILLSVFLGTRYSVSAAFGISLLRNVLGTGSLLAFPGSMIGAALAGILFRRIGSFAGAVLGEIVGTGIFGGLTAFPVAQYVLGTEVGTFFFVIPFLVSTIGGSLIAYLIYLSPIQAFFREKLAK